MFRAVAWILIVCGAGLFGYNAFQWWDQSSAAVIDPKSAQSVSPEWDQRQPKPALKSGIKQNLPEVKAGEQVGELVIPRLGAIIPVVEDTTEEALENGVGLYEGYGTVNPGETGHVVLSGHRDTVFRDVGKLKIGDRVYVRYGDYYFEYQIRKTWVTHAEDRTVIVPHPKPILSLTTCFPFDYVGDAPDRYIIRAELIGMKKGKPLEMDSWLSF